MRDKSKIRKAMETALYMGKQWEALHEGNIARRISSRGRNKRLIGIPRTLAPVNNSRNLKDSKGTEYRFERAGNLVRASNK